MPINFDLDEIRKKYNCINYFETGLWDPRTNVSCKKALHPRKFKMEQNNYII